MTNWAPSTTFDDELLDIQPECDVTFANYPVDDTKMAASFFDLQSEPYVIPDRHRDANIVQKLIPPIGKLVTPEDLEESDTREYEILTMIRNIGMGPSIDECLTSTRTIPAITSDKPYTNKTFPPILFDDAFFKLKPRKSNSSMSGGSNSTSFNSVSDSSMSDVLKPIQIEVSHNDQQTSRTTTRIPVPDILPTSSKPRRKIAAQFNNKHVMDHSCDNDYDVDSIRKKLVFMTPLELYKQKRQQVISQSRGH